MATKITPTHSPIYPHIQENSPTHSFSKQNYLPKITTPHNTTTPLLHKPPTPPSKEEQEQTITHAIQLLNTIPSSNQETLEKHLLNLLKKRLQDDQEFQTLALEIATLYQKNKLAATQQYAELKNIAQTQKTDLQTTKNILLSLNTISLILGTLLCGNLLLATEISQTLNALSAISGISTGTTSILHTLSENNNQKFTATITSYQGKINLLEELCKIWSSSFTKATTSIQNDMKTMQILNKTQQQALLWK